ncbi:hypothetical protein O181_076190 [Austropuccinia psidii MF-1]|uniref:Reverse transcriptase Ty1/copia-type domain-containing protein n=1 Tax=Austropuccinia psidii MF-1 TaxID=1389203 RepID=A0A9Q3F861_9BASI|nr:hypothetical protein [Austropuccinia psidii MF-1]
MPGIWLLWDQNTNKMLQLVGVIFPQFQPCRQAATPVKGCLTHIMNAMVLGEVPTEQYFDEENCAVSSLPLVEDVKIPSHLGQALNGPHNNQWQTACMTELNQMAARDVWDIVVKEPGMKTIGHWWVFDLKINADGSIERFKARLVAHGDKQHPGIDSAETHAPTASLMSLCLILATAVLNGCQVASFYVSGTYLYSPVDECVLVEPPTLILPELCGKVLSLKKALYGMRQAGRCWWKILLGFIATEVDQSLYIFCSKTEIIAIWIPIDNGVVTSNSLVAISDFNAVLVSQLVIKFSGQLDPIVGLECVFSKGEVAITQRLLPVGVPTSDATPFQSVNGLLAYLVSRLRLDLALSVNYLARHFMGPTPAHWDLLDHVVGYLHRTRGHGIRLCLGNTSLNLWSNAGWGGDLKRSQTGKRTYTLGLKVALSTCAAEYMALSHSTQHLVQAISQLWQLVGEFDKMIFCNNQAVVQVLLDNKSHKRMRYLDRAFFFVNDTICKYSIKITWLKTDDMLADALTKRLLGPTFLLALPFLE